MVMMPNLEWPYDYQAIRQERYKRAFLIREDRNLQIMMMVYYKTHPIEWINDWCFTFDPRLDGIKIVPFMLFQRQREFIELLVECVRTKESALVEKCRDVGASWLCVAFSVWLWLFHAGSAIGWGSRKEEYVDDKGNPKAIFPKIRQLLERLPAWMMPFGFSMREHAPYMKIINPANGATIVGEAGDNIGRGGRTTIFFKDESAHYLRSELIEAALSANTNVQIDISSVNGIGNVFYKRRMAGIIWEREKVIPKGYTRVFIFDWRDHPGKSQEWHDTMRAKFEREGMLHVFAQEVERDYMGSRDKSIIDPAWIEASFDAHIDMPQLGDWLTGKTIAGQDIADDGGDKHALNIRKGVVTNFNDCWGGKAEDCAAVALPYLLKFGVDEAFYDAIGVGTAFKASMNGFQEADDADPAVKQINILPWKGSWEVLDPKEPIIEGAKTLNEDHYENLKAQAWERTAQRAYKTYQARHRGKIYPVDELMSISTEIEGRHALKAELSQAQRKNSGNGKSMVDKTPKDTSSPNRADGLVICYNPAREPMGFFDMD